MVAHLFSHLLLTTAVMSRQTSLRLRVCVLTRCRNMAAQYGHLLTGGGAICSLCTYECLLCANEQMLCILSDFMQLKTYICIVCTDVSM